MLNLSSEDRETLLPNERDAALALLKASQRVSHSLKLGFWPKDNRLADFEAAVQEANRVIGVKNVASINRPAQRR